MRQTIFIGFLVCGFFQTFAQSKSQAKWQQAVDYQINVTLFDDINTVVGDIVMTYTNNSPNVLEKMYIHLWPNAYKNNETAFAKQMVENRKLDFQYAKSSQRGEISDIAFKINNVDVTYAPYRGNIDVAEIMLPRPILPGEIVTISTPFSVRVPELFSRMGREDGEYYLTQWYPKPAVYDVNGWNPMPYLDQGEFYSEFGNFEVKIALPSNFLVAATGELQEDSEKGVIQNRIENPESWENTPFSDSTFKILTFKAENVHDFAWFASKTYNVLYDTVMIDNQKVDIFIFAKDPKKENLKDVKNALTYYSEHVGNYPYPHATVVHGGLKAGGGMEYPMITICASMDAHTVVHEVGHNWFYGILGTNERTYPWMDESINSFYDQRAAGASLKINETGMGKLGKLLNKEQRLASHHQHVGCKSQEFTNLNYGMIVYGLGPYYFEYLEAYLGAGLFKKCMKTYFDLWKFRHPLPDDMKNVFEAVSGKNLSWFFDDIISSNKKMDYAIFKDKNDKVLIKNTGEVAAPISVDLLDFSSQWYILNPGAIDTVGKQSGNKSDAWSLDRRGVTADLNQNNNVLHRKISLKPLSNLKQKTDLGIYYLPALGWNNFDGLMLGAMFHNHELVSKKLNYHLAPMYGLNSQQLTGLGNITYTKGLKKQGSYLQAGIDIRRFSEKASPLSALDVSYNKLKPYFNFYLPKYNLRTSAERKIGIDVHSIWFNNQFDVTQQQQISKNPQFESKIAQNFLVLNYEIKQNRSLNAYYWLIEFEQAFTSNTIQMARRDVHIFGGETIIRMVPIGEEQVNNSHSKLSTIFKYDLDIGIKKRPLKMRFYGSYFLTDPADGLFNFRIAGNGGVNDYRRDNLMMYRFAQTGLFSRQVTDDKEFSKFVGVLTTPARWMWNFNATLPLPGKIPVAPFIELLSFDNLNSTLGVDVLFMFGMQVTVIPNYLEVYLNFAQTSAYTERMDGLLTNPITKFHERITFKFKLDNLRPFQIKKQIAETTGF